jgi:hypothetical protein
MAKRLYGVACLVITLAGFPVLPVIAQQQPNYSHPATAEAPPQADPQIALDMHVPLLDRELPEPSYGPAAPAGDMAEQAGMPEGMDHSAHQMPGTTNSSAGGATQ